MLDVVTRADGGRVPALARSRLSITAIILTFNEDIHIQRCLANAAQVAERLVIIDSFSSDRTVEIARQFGADVYQRRFLNQAEQFQWALDNCDIRSEWVLRLDADEYLEPELIKEIRTRLPLLPIEVTGVRLRRKLIFRGKWIRYGGYYPTVLLRLWRTGKAEIQQLWMDEHAVLKEGKSIVFKQDFCDHNLRDITWWTDKHNRYSTRKMADFIALEFGPGRAAGTEREKTDQARTWQKSAQYWAFRKTPLYFRSVLYFLYRYIIRLGFLDGKQGFLWHALQGLWYFLLIDLKIEDARAFIAAHGVEAFKDHLKSHHEIDLSGWTPSSPHIP